MQARVDILFDMQMNTLVHIICGCITVLAGYFLYPLLGIGLWISFLVIEVWDKEEWASSKFDFWEFVLGVFCCSAALLFLRF